MKKTLWLGMLLMTSGGAIAKTPVQAPPKAATLAQMKSFATLYAQGDKALAQRDMKLARLKMTPDFTLNLFGETIERAQYLSSMSDFFAQIIKVKSAKSTIEKLELRGKRMFVTATSTSEFTMSGEDKKPHLFKMVQRSLDVWIPTSRGWQVQAVTALSERNFIDGKQVSARP